MTKAYIVKGSEDGVIGVYGSKKKALECAKRYCGTGCDIDDTCDHWTNVEGSFCSAEITLWYVNNDYV